MLKVFKAGNGVFLPQLRIGLDYSGLNTDYVFVSHAHSDHIPRQTETSFYATRPTSRFMKLRGFNKAVQKLDFFQSIETDSAKITFYPAGHILGSAMTFIESDYGNLLYTGDYKTPASSVSEGFRLPDIPVDIFITEATFGLPLYRWHDESVLKQQLTDFAQESFEHGFTPVYLAYNLGKAQELMHLLKETGREIQIHAAGYEISKIYSDEGIDLGNYASLSDSYNEETIIICPSSSLSNNDLNHIPRKRIAYCSGWAALRHHKFKMPADKYIPISDHLDFFELLNVCESLNPGKVLITHTPNPKVVQHYLNKRNIHNSLLADHSWN